MTIGQRIRNRRIELGLSVDQLAKTLNKNRATIYRYENNFIEKLPTSALEPLAVALKTTPAYFMGWETTIKNSISLITNQITAVTRSGEKFQYNFTDEDMQTILSLMERMKKN